MENEEETRDSRNGDDPSSKPVEKGKERKSKKVQKSARRQTAAAKHQKKNRLNHRNDKITPAVRKTAGPKHCLSTHRSKNKKP